MTRRILVFLCAGVLSGLAANLIDYTVIPFLAATQNLSFILWVVLAPWLLPGLILLALLSVRLWHHQQRTEGWTVATLLSPLTATIASYLMYVASVIGRMSSDQTLLYLIADLPRETPNRTALLITSVPLSEWLWTAWWTALAGGLAGSVLALGLFPLLRPKTRRMLILAGMGIGLLVLPCMLVWQQFATIPSELLPGNRGLWLCLIAPIDGPLRPIAFGLFAAVLAWCLQARVTEKA